MTAGTRAKARDYSLPKRCPLHVVVGFSPRSYSVQYFYETHAGAAVELATGRAGRRATGAAPPDAIGIAFIDLNPSHVRLCLGQRELHPSCELIARERNNSPPCITARRDGCVINKISRSNRS